ncbi:ABC transporter substrate-binding protein [Neobacillus cucumis]|uniref:ABC transporter substrate-binding protein n=1 Tax=Neobacillus cucumis TaxID=1740721 RepID=UPI0019659703|nr:extracellular solute-binding protein [Neobacillus cucumis]MBM7654524.1 raffinose/stachyose/melibiose transport system substrate-binding protein [Neobacillus cucumis]
MKSLFRFIFLLTVFLMTACGGHQVKKITANKEPVQLEFLSPKFETESIFNELIHEFELQHPTVKIHQVVVPEGMTVLKTRIARGDIPDIFITYPIEQDYLIRAEKGYLLDLTHEDFIQNIDPNVQNRYLVNGKMYGIALTQNAVGVLYNKDQFRELHLSIPKTWDEFIAVMEKLKTAGKTPLLMPNKDASKTSVFNLNLVANQINNQYWSQDSFSLLKDPRWREISEKTVKSLSFVQPNSFQDDYFAVNRKFANGEGAMYVMGTWVLPEIEKNKPRFQYGIFPFPATNQPNQNKVLGGVDIGLAISSDTKHPKEAKEFLAFLTKKDIAQRLSDYEGSISTVKGVKVNKEQLRLLNEEITQGKSVNWPNHYWSGGTAAESDFRKYSSQFYYDKNIDSYLINLENMFNHYKDSNRR